MAPKRPLRPVEYAYWAMFLLAGFVMTNIILGAIHASAREETSFLQSSALLKHNPTLTLDDDLPTSTPATEVRE